LNYLKTSNSIFKNHFPLPPQGEVGPSSSSTPSIVLFDDSPFAITCDLVFQDATKENPKKIKLHEGAKKFQDGWTIQLPWAENVIGDKGLAHQVWCKVCTHVKGKEKLLAPNLDSLLKHVNCYKCKVSMPSVDTSFYYFNKNLVHAKNEHAYITHDQPLVLENILANVPIE
jgi:hypothetical protein